MKLLKDMSQIKWRLKILISNLIFVTFLLYASTSMGQANSKFGCPVNGSIIRNFEETSNSGNDIKALRFKSIDGNIYSCSDGEVVSLDSVNNRTVASIKSGKYVLSYYDLDSTNLRVGNKIKAGTVIGKVSYKELMLMMTKKGKLLIGIEILKRIRCDE